jgi:hypothetical protein
MKKNDSIKELCRLVTEVGERVFNSTIAHDCFCGENEYTSGIVHPDIIEYIKQAVYDKMLKTPYHERIVRVMGEGDFARVQDAVEYITNVEKEKPTKIPVIKRLRDQFGYGLKECKDLVEDACLRGYTKKVHYATNEGMCSYYYAVNR